MQSGSGNTLPLIPLLASTSIGTGSCFFFFPYRASREGYKECSSDVKIVLSPQVFRRTSSSVNLG